MSWTTCEISSTGESTPVEVSAWTTATSLGRILSAAARICGGETIWPQGLSTRWTSAPQRSATSQIRFPNRPLTPTTTGSPGSIRLARQNSMPALPVPLTGKVISLLVRNTWRSMPLISSISCRKRGSRWLTRGSARVSRTVEGTLLGPGPISS